MNIDERNRKNKGVNNFRGAMHIGIGGLYLVIGGSLIYFKKFGTIPTSAVFAYVVGTLVVLYGLFRIWRGLQFMRQ